MDRVCTCYKESEFMRSSTAMVFLRPSRMGFLRLMSQMLCKSHQMDLMSTLHF